MSYHHIPGNSRQFWIGTAKQDLQNAALCLELLAQNGYALTEAEAAELTTLVDQIRLSHAVATGLQEPVMVHKSKPAFPS